MFSTTGGASIYGIDNTASGSAMFVPQDATISNDELLNDIFQPILDELNTMFINYKNANFNEVDTELTLLKKERVSSKISSKVLIVSDSQIQKNILTYISNSFGGIQQSILQYKELLSCIAQIQGLSEKVSILNDSDKLAAYIKSLQNPTNIFDLPAVTTILATLKPQYTLYIERYGFPEGSVFDPILLGEILTELGIEE